MRKVYGGLGVVAAIGVLVVGVNLLTPEHSAGNHTGESWETEYEDTFTGVSEESMAKLDDSIGKLQQAARSDVESDTLWNDVQEAVEGLNEGVKPYDKMWKVPDGYQEFNRQYWGVITSVRELRGDVREAVVTRDKKLLEQVGKKLDLVSEQLDESKSRLMMAQNRTAR